MNGLALYGGNLLKEKQTNKQMAVTHQLLVFSVIHKADELSFLTFDMDKRSTRAAPYRALTLSQADYAFN